MERGADRSRPGRRRAGRDRPSSGQGTLTLPSERNTALTSVTSAAVPELYSWCRPAPGVDSAFRQPGETDRVGRGVHRAELRHATGQRLRTERHGARKFLGLLLRLSGSAPDSAGRAPAARRSPKKQHRRQKSAGMA